MKDLKQILMNKYGKDQTQIKKLDFLMRNMDKQKFLN